ncbi:hypothetical protein [Bacteroides gallinaceum]|uniref:DUF4286 family protein n=1 Tax=Bacteroides gallinaceum TaxID=1462571 RepID=A0ABT7VFB0_9BACE|nr:hypothetical protein [Bacteroides gallinaceum]MDM8324994.1 hypothetical protein [Bacteroides gallinaceum]
MEKTLFLSASVEDAYITQFWARLDALVQMYNERYSNIIFADLKEKEANIFFVYVRTKEKEEFETLKNACEDFAQNASSLIPTDYVTLNLFIKNLEKQ